LKLFSEGLYASPNKAVEELVANSFDAGAQHVAVLLSPNLHAQDATITVIDDGDGMGIEGLKQHWLIGVSNKRKLGKLPRGRQQIGQFGIGKLATYILANRLSHVSKFKGKYYATSMDYWSINSRVEREVEPKILIKLALRELTEAEAKEAVREWTDTSAFKAGGFELFGKKASVSWTVAIMSSLKDKVHEIKPGTLEWVLRTALPLRDDFTIPNFTVDSSAGFGSGTGFEVLVPGCPSPLHVVAEHSQWACRLERLVGADGIAFYRLHAPKGRREGEGDDSRTAKKLSI
jgi:hypothetical protein